MCWHIHTQTGIQRTNTNFINLPTKLDTRKQEKIINNNTSSRMDWRKKYISEQKYINTGAETGNCLLQYMGANNNDNEEACSRGSYYLTHRHLPWNTTGDVDRRVGEEAGEIKHCTRITCLGPRLLPPHPSPYNMRSVKHTHDRLKCVHVRECVRACVSVCERDKHVRAYERLIDYLLLHNL